MAARRLLATPTASLLVLLALMATAGALVASDNTTAKVRASLQASVQGECGECPACPSPALPSAQPQSSAYDHHVGLGYYKMHYDLRTWPEAQATCEREGGYLIVINSQAEADMASKYMKKYNLTGYIHVGFFDVTLKGRYITVQGKPLKSTGYTVWAPKEPNNVGNENCGSFYINKGLNDVNCNHSKRFLCELGN